MNKNILKSFCVSSKNRFSVDSFFRRHAFQVGVGFFSSDSLQTTRCHVLIHLPLIYFFSASICLEIFILTLVRAQMQMHADAGCQAYHAGTLAPHRLAHTHIRMKTKHTHTHSVWVRSSAAHIHKPGACFSSLCWKRLPTSRAIPQAL